MTTSYPIATLFLSRRESASPLPPFEVNSNGPTLTPDRALLALGLLMDFYESINFILPWLERGQDEICDLRAIIDELSPANNGIRFTY